METSFSAVMLMQHTQMSLLKTALETRARQITPFFNPQRHRRHWLSNRHHGMDLSSIILATYLPNKIHQQNGRRSENYPFQNGHNFQIPCVFQL
jgi:hypothetical protein